MPLTFNAFNLQDSNFITERIIFKGFGDRALTRAKIGRREGIKLLSSEFGEKEVTIEGNLIAASASELQSLIDDMKKALTAEEADLVLETGRTYTATVKNLIAPDEHYNQSKSPYEVTFICTDPFARASLVTAVINVPSGVTTVSGTVTISGTFFNRPTITYTPAGQSSGQTLIQGIQIYHVESGQQVTVSGFGSGVNLDYSDPVTVNFDTFISLEGGDVIGNSGSFARWDPGTNEFTITVTGNRRFPGGSITISHQPRFA
jgi:predicted phage tail component-like protein